MKLYLVALMVIGAALGTGISRRNVPPDIHLDKRQFGLAQTQGINASRPDFSPVHLEVRTKSGGRNETAPLLYGLIFEDITVRSILNADVTI